MPDEAENVETMAAKLSRLSIEKEEAELAAAVMREELAAANRRAEAAEARLQEMLAERSTDAPESLPPVPAPSAPPAPPQTLLTIGQLLRQCLQQPKQPGLYIYHVKCLTVHRVARPNEEWCVVKVGITGDLKTRMNTERNEIRRYRGLPFKLRITAEDLEDNDVGDFVALFTGVGWNGKGMEDKIRTSMGLPLGKGIVMDNESEAVRQMITQHNVSQSYRSGDGKIQVAGWRAYLSPRTITLSGRSQVGPSEFIMMPKQAMEELREKFKENPAAFTETRENSRAWTWVNEEAKDALQAALPPGWEKTRVIVQFNPYELTFATEDVSKLKVEQIRRLLGYPEDHEGSWAELRRECNEAVARSLSHQPFTEALTAYATSARDAAAVRAFSQSVGDVSGGVPGVAREFQPSQERVAELIPPLKLRLWRDPS